MECKSCGAQIGESLTACPYCQAAISKPLATQETIAIPSQPAAVPQKNKTERENVSLNPSGSFLLAGSNLVCHDAGYEQVVELCLRLKKS